MNDVIATDERAEQAVRAIDLVSEGMTLKRACEAVGMTPGAFVHCLTRLRNLAERYAHAQAVRADLLADEVIELADGSGDPSKVRNQMQGRQWRASKLAPKTYGDRLDIAVTQSISVGDALAEARSRLLRPVSDQQVIEDAQVVDSQAIALPTPSDEASQGADEPDIFS